MNLKDFDVFVGREMQACKSIMTAKNADYSAGNDKLANFKLAGQIEGVHPIVTLYEMDLKHRVSIQQGINDLKCGKIRPIPWWQEKIRDHINYQYLLLALIEDYRTGPEG